MQKNCRWNRYSRQTKSEAGQNGELLRLAHLQLPDGSDRENEDVEIRDDVRHDQRLEDQDLIHTFADSLQRPLLLDRVAEEDEDEGEDDSPHDHQGDPRVNPDLQLA